MPSRERGLLLMPPTSIDAIPRTTGAVGLTRVGIAVEPRRAHDTMRRATWYAAAYGNSMPSASRQRHHRVDPVEPAVGHPHEAPERDTTEVPDRVERGRDRVGAGADDGRERTSERREQPTALVGDRVEDGVIVRREMDDLRQVDRAEQQERVDVVVTDAQAEVEHGAVVPVAGTTAVGRRAATSTSARPVHGGVAQVRSTTCATRSRARPRRATEPATKPAYATTPSPAAATAVPAGAA